MRQPWLNDEKKFRVSEFLQLGYVLEQRISCKKGFETDFDNYSRDFFEQRIDTVIDLINFQIQISQPFCILSFWMVQIVNYGSNWFGQRKWVIVKVLK